MTNEKNEKKLNPPAQKVVDFLSAHRGEAFTLKEIGDGIGEKMNSSGAITRLLRSVKNPDGIIVHGAEREKVIEVKRKVFTYMIEADGE